MRFLRFLSAVTALFTAGRVAAGSTLVEPRTISSLDTRALVDVCASVDADLKVDLLGIVIVVGHLDVCLCLSALPLFIETNVVAVAAVALVGEGVVSAAITALINDAAPKSQCKFPEHATPACVDNNPCGFQCGDGFTPSPAKKPTQCVCEPPKTVCNGVCGKFPHCATSKPLSKRDKRWEGSGTCTSRGEGWMACGVFGGAARAWECIDTTNDLESCGGCAIPLTPYTPFGVDCTAIPGVADVSCLSGSCIVHRCLPGFMRTADASECIRAHVSSPAFAHKESQMWENEIPAMDYGLEHSPLKH
ncbi:hypothetical protein EVG20_g5973 [Dentipellis fragilis]|uniref:Protein CPL1-like domain-containing protein n=1 Tax=Dentipellis fragilis TaxID=205917 RepID=A0A4Y9YP28_9AGAM|nr:hypothetical protein EVG20_g5973 [Dentipellis fragilis]